MASYSSDLERVWTTTPAPAKKISSSARSVERERERDLRRKIRDGHSNVTYTLSSMTTQRGTRRWSSCNSNHRTRRYSYWIVNIWYTRVRLQGEHVLIDWLMAAQKRLCTGWVYKHTVRSVHENAIMTCLIAAWFPFFALRKRRLHLACRHVFRKEENSGHPSWQEVFPLL
jgi:hypothetical protein